MLSAASGRCRNEQRNPLWNITGRHSLNRLVLNHLSLRVRWQTVMVKRLFLHQKTVLSCTARLAPANHPFKPRGGGGRKEKKKGGGPGSILYSGRQPKFLPLLRLPPVSIPISSCLAKMRTAQHARAASLCKAGSRHRLPMRCRSLAVRVTGVIHAPHLVQVSHFFFFCKMLNEDYFFLHFIVHKNFKNT